MTELNPCPFCGGEAERIDIEDGENAGGSCICCTVCQASGGIEFGRKENFVSNWNRRSTMKTKSPEFEMEITVALRHAASGMADRLQQTNAIDRAIAFISEARATGRREGMESMISWHAKEIERLDEQIDENNAYRIRVGSVDTSRANKYCADNKYFHEKSIAAIRAAMEKEK